MSIGWTNRRRAFGPWVIGSGLLVSTLAACGSDAGGSTNGGTQRQQLEAYVKAERKAICTVYASCCTEAERAHATPISAFVFAGPEAWTEAGCLAALEQLFPATQQAAYFESQIEQGTATWDPSKVDACIAAWESCTIPRLKKAGFWGEACPEPPIVPTRKLGEPCQSYADCAEGTCADDGGAKRCVPMPVAGSACLEVEKDLKACDDSAYCKAGSDECLPLGPIGASCTGNWECASGECHSRPFEVGMCAESTICDGDGTNDEGLVLADCSETDRTTGRGIACELNTAGTWTCACDDGTGSQTSCEAKFDVAQQNDPRGTCRALGCCGF